MTRLTPPVPIAGLDTGPATPLEFSRAWLAKAERVRQRRAELEATGQLDGVDPDSLAALGAALTGTLRIPVIPVRYSNVPAPFSHTILQDRIFGTATGDSVSLASYWDEVSGGLLQIEGGVAPWIRLRRPGRHYLPHEEYGWASFGRAPDLVRDVLSAAADHIDFTGFDNDGPDGIPNSGDDDGFVDLVVILYAVPCKGEWRDGAIWPHRGAIPPVRTKARSANGGYIQISDYLILPVQEPGTCDPLQVGILAHETGHALGLPDLYDYDGAAKGAGAWDLMANGSHSALHSPAHLSAWSKEQLGWVRVDWIRPGQDSLRLLPVNHERRILRYDLPETSGKYILLENRQRIGTDSYLPGTGIIAWKIDPERAAIGGWNGIGRYRGVELIRTGGARTTPSIPGPDRQDEIDLGPGSKLRLSRIREGWKGEITAQISAGYDSPTLIATDPLRLRITPDDTSQSRAFLIRARGGAAGNWMPSTDAPWATVQRWGDLLTITADPKGLQPGLYTDTIYLTYPQPSGAGEGEENGGDTGPNSALVVHLEVADPTSMTILGTNLPWGWGLAVEHGRIYQASFGRDALSLQPRPRLLRIQGPDQEVETLARINDADAIYTPLIGPYGRVYLIAAVRDQNEIIEIDDDGRARLIATLPGEAPAYGAARTEDNRLLIADWTGKITQVTHDGQTAPWVDLKRNIYQITIAGDGNLYAAAYNGNLLRYEPMTGRLTTIPTGFGTGRLVALTTSPNGGVLAAERGGAGRIIEVEPDGSWTEVTRIDGAEIYGLAADDRFLYVLDLGNRQLIRLPLPVGQGHRSRGSGSMTEGPGYVTSSEPGSADHHP